MKPSPFSHQFLTLLTSTVVYFAMAGAGSAAGIYWDGTGTDWQTVGNWSGAAGAATPDPTAIPGASDLAIFSISSLTNSAQTVNLNADQSVLGLSFVGTNTATTTLLGGGTNRTLTLGGSGLTVASGAGAVTIGSVTGGDNVAIVLGGAQSWTNDSANALTVVNGVTNGGFLLSVAGTGNTALSGVVSGSGGLAKAGSGTLTLSGSNSFTGTTTVSAGTLKLAGSGAITASTAFTLSGGTLSLDNTAAAGGNLNNRLNNAAGIALSGGNFVFKGADAATTNSTETIGALSGTGNSMVTVAFGGTNRAVMTAASFTHAAGNGTMLINGTSLGKDSASTASVGRLIVTTAPTLVGTTAGSSGGRTNTKNLQIVPFLVGEATVASLGLGTVTGTANTFLTYHSTTGLRPLNPTDEFTNNTITSGNNTRITTNTNVGANTSINSLVIANGNLTIGSGTSSRTLTVTSGALLFTTANSIAKGSGSSNSLAFGSTEAQITVNSSIIGTIAARITGSGGLTKSGGGTLSLTNANTYTGTTTVTAGTLSFGIANALSSGAVTVAGGTLDMQTFADTVGAVTLTSGTITGGTGGVLTGTSYALQSGTVSAILGGAVTLTKSTTGTVVLSKANTYTGATNVTGGVLNIRQDSALGTTAGGVSVADGAALELQDGISVGAEALTLNGTGVSSGGALRNLSGDNTYGGDITLASNSKIASDAGVLSLTGTIGGNFDMILGGAGGITANGVISGTGTLSKEGVGTLILTAINSYTSALALSGGTVQLSGSGSLGSGSNVTVSADGLSGLSAILDLFGLDATIGSLTLGGATAVGGDSGAKTNTVQTGVGTLTLGGDVLFNGDLGNQGTNAITGNLALGGSTRSFTVNGLSSSLGVSAAVSGAGGLTKAGEGTLNLSGSNSFSGALSIDAGSLSIATINNASASGPLGNSAAAVSMGHTGGVTGTLSYTGATASSSKPFTLASGGTGAFAVTDAGAVLTLSGLIDGAGSLAKTGAGGLILAGANSFTGGVTLDSGILQLGDAAALNATVGSENAVTFGSGSTGTLRLDGRSVTIANLASNATVGTPVVENANATPATLTVGNLADLSGTFAGVLQDGSGGGALSLKKAGSGTLTLAGVNSFTGATVIGGGSLQLAGSGTLGTGGDVTVSADGLSGPIATLDLNDRSISIGSLTLGGPMASGGEGAGKTNTVQTGTGTLTLGGNVLFNGGLGNQGANTISGKLDLGAATRTFTVDGTAASTLGISAVVSGAVGLTKAGGGVLELTGSNSYSGVTTLSSGTLALGHASALGGGGNLTFGGGSLRYSASNTADLAGKIVSSSSAITINTNGQNVTWAGNLVVSNTGGLTKTGTGTLTLSGTNAYTGSTTINDGTLGLASDSAISSGSLILNGGNLAASGAARTLSNATTLTAGSTLDAGSVGLALSGTIANGGHLLTVTGTGETALSGIISGAGGITKLGTGKLILSGASTFLGDVAITEGVINVRNATGLGASGTGAATVSSGAALEIQGGITIDLPITLNGSGVANTGALRNISDNNAMAGLFTLGSNTLIGSDSGVLTISNLISSSGTQLGIVGAGAISLGSLSIGANTLTKSSSGTLTLTGASDHANTIVSSGRLNINHSEALGSAAGALTLTTGVTLGNTSGADIQVQVAKSIALGTSLTYAGDNHLDLGTGTATLTGNTSITVDSGKLQFGGDLVQSGGTWGLTKLGTGILELTGLTGTGTSYAGTTEVKAGELLLSGSSSFNGTVVKLYDGATLRLLPGTNLGHATISYQGTGTGTYVPAGTATDANVDYGVTMSLPTSSALANGLHTVKSGVVLAAAEDYFGTNPVSATGRIVMENTATLKAISNFAINANKGIALNAGSSTLQTETGQILTVASVVSGAGKLLKTGTGELSLTGTNTYSGGTEVQAGTLLAWSNDSVGTGTLLLSGGTLEAPASYTLTRSIQLDAGETSGMTVRTGETLTYGNAISQIAGTAANLSIGSDAHQGTAVFSGANSYTGSTQIHAGTLEVTSLGNGGIASPLGASTSDAANLLLHGGTLKFSGTSAGSTDRLFSLGASGGTLDGSGSVPLAFSNSGAMALAGEVGARTLILTGSTSGSLAASLTDLGGDTMVTKRGSGTWTLSGTSTYTGETAIEAGTLQISSSANLGTGPLWFTGAGIQDRTLAATDDVTTPRAVLLTATGTLETAAAKTTTLSGLVSGTGGLIKTGSGTLALSFIDPIDGSGNTFSGGTTISGGTLKVAAPGALGSGAIANNAALELYGNLGLISNTITGTGTLSKVAGAAGTTTELIGSASNTYSGLTTVSGGTLRLNKSSGAQAIGGNVLVAGGILILQGTEQIGNSAAVTLTTGTLDFGASYGTGRTETIGTIVKSGGNFRTYGNTFTTGAFELSGSAGVTLVNSLGGVRGSLEVGAGGLLFSGGTNPTLTIDSEAGTANRLLLGGNVTSTLGSGTAKILSGGASASLGLIDLGASARSFNVADGSAATDMEISASISNGGLTKTGAGALALTGSNDFTGTLTLSGGTLNAATAGIHGSSATNGIVFNGGTLQAASGGIATAKAVTLTGAGTLDTNGDSIALTGILSGSGALTKTGVGTLTLSGANSGFIGGTTVASGTLAFNHLNALGSSAVNLGVASTSSGTLEWTGGTATVANNINILGNGSDTIRNSGSGVLNLSGILTKNGNFLLLDGGVSGIVHTGSFAGTVANLQTLGSVAVNGSLPVDSQVVVGNSETSSELVVGGLTGGTVVGGNATTTSTLVVVAASETTDVFTGGFGGATTAEKNLGLIKSGAGTLELAGSTANTHTGDTVVTAGVLRLNKGSSKVAIPAALKIQGGSVLILASGQFASTTAITVTSGSLGFTGSGIASSFNTFTMSGGSFATGANTLTGSGNSVNLASGTYTISAGGTVSDAHWNVTGGTNLVEGGATRGNLVVASSGLGLEFGGTENPTITLNSDASQAGRILLSGDLTVAASLTSGTAQIVSGGVATNQGFIDLNAGTRTFSVNNGSADTDLLISAVVTNGGLTKTGAGTLALSGSNDFTGILTLSGGTLNAATAGIHGSSATNGIAFNSGTLQAASGGIATAKAITLTGAGTLDTNGNAIALSGVISGSGALTKTGVGTLTLSGSNDFTGALTLSGGTLNTATAGINGSSATNGIDFNGGTLQAASGGIATAKAVTLTGPGTLDTNGNAIGLTGIISGGGALTKTGAGTLTLSGANSFTGATTISAGTVTLASGASLASPLICVGDAGSSGTVLNVTALTGGFTIGAGQTLAGIGTIDASGVGLTIAGTHAPGNSPGVQSVTGDLSYAAISIFEWELASSAVGTRGTDYDGVDVSGNLSGVTGATFKVVLSAGSFTTDTFWQSPHSWAGIFTSSNTPDLASVFSNVQWTEFGSGVTTTDHVTSPGYFTVSGSSLNWSLVPEPTSAVAGLLLMAGLMQRRRDRAGSPCVSAEVQGNRQPG